MKRVFFALGFLLVFACSKTSTSNIQMPTPTTPVVTTPTPNIVYSVKMLDSFSAINKLTSWYITNKAFSGIIDVTRTSYWGFQSMAGDYIPFNSSSNWSSANTYYFQGNGGHIYTDLDGDGQKDLFVPYALAPGPLNSQCLFMYSNYQLNPNKYSLQLSLTAPRKLVLSDFDNDGKNEIMIFSHGYDANPFPGDSMAIFHVQNQSFQYLSKEIGYYHGGAVGDINNDGLPDILGYSGGSAVIPIHPMSYINNGNFNFTLQKNIFQGFTSGSYDNFYSVELMDLNKDGKLDLVLAGNGIGIVIPQTNGIYNRANAISLPVKSNQFPNSLNFLDLNGDGNLDIISGYTVNYNNYGVAIYIYSNGQYVEKTSDYVDKSDFPGPVNAQLPSDWIMWYYLYDKDGDGALDIVGDGVQGSGLTNSASQPMKEIWWKNVSGKFIYTVKSL
jgi:hypothetical protein